MKNRLVIFLLACLMLSCASQRETDWKRLNLKGEVNSIRTRGYKMKMTESKLDKEELCNRVNWLLVFDNQGRILEDVNYNLDESIKNKEIYSFSGGKMAEGIYYNEKGEVDTKTVFTYKNDKLASRIAFSGDNSVRYKTEYEYHGEHLVGLKTFFEDSFLYAFRFIYRGDLQVAVLHCDKKGREEFRTTYEYDEKGRRIRIVDTELVVQINYDDFDNPVKIINGRACAKMVQPRKDKSYRYEYEYDEEGNWVKRTEFVLGETNPNFIVKREIIYH
jgi:YD repeat-containing protein